MVFCDKYIHARKDIVLKTTGASWRGNGSGIQLPLAKIVDIVTHDQPTLIYMIYISSSAVVCHI